jgi:uncharacterized short protein YbdD (DUF466 family)
MLPQKVLSGVLAGAGLGPPAWNAWLIRLARFTRRGLGRTGTGFSLSSYGIWSRRAARGMWWGLRDWCGDSAYERYRRSKGARSGSRRLLTPAEFYVEQLDRRYSRPNRCC